MIRLFKWISGFLVALLIIFGGVLYALTRDDVQEMLYQSSLRMLAETLQTKVTAKNIAVDFKHGGVALYGDPSFLSITCAPDVPQNHF